MEKRFTMADLKAASGGKSRQALYNLMRNNPDLAALLENHSTVDGHNRFYDVSIVEWVKDYYFKQQKGPAIAADVPITFSEEQNSNNPNNTSPLMVDELQARIKDLEAQLESKDATINELIQQATEAQKQASQLLLLLQEEKQEKMKLLPAPSKGIFTKIKGLFKKSNANQTSND